MRRTALCGAVRGFGNEARCAQQSDPRLPQDGPLLPAAVDWIDAHKSKPFFLTLWTMDTHHPYIVAGDRNYGVRAATRAPIPH